MPKKHTVVLQLLREVWCTEIDYNHWCWYSSWSKEIHKFRTRIAFGEGNYCHGTITQARICNEQIFKSVIYAWSVTWRRILLWNKTVIHARNAKKEMIHIISLKIICIHFGMRLKMTGPFEWIQMERRFLDLIDLTNCWDWAWLRNFLFEDVKILWHQYIYQMRPLH